MVPSRYRNEVSSRQLDLPRAAAVRAGRRVLREAGNHSRARSIQVHQFGKVEGFVYCTQARARARAACWAGSAGCWHASRCRIRDVAAQVISARQPALKFERGLTGGLSRADVDVEAAPPFRRAGWRPATGIPAHGKPRIGHPQRNAATHPAGCDPGGYQRPDGGVKSPRRTGSRSWCRKCWSRSMQQRRSRARGRPGETGRRHWLRPGSVSENCR